MMIPMTSLGSDDVFQDSMTDPEAGITWRPAIMASDETSGYFSTRSQSFPNLPGRLNTFQFDVSERTSTPHQGFGGMVENLAGFGGLSKERSGRRFGARNRAIMPLLGLIMALVIIIMVLAILLVVSHEKSPQTSTILSDPNEPVDVPFYGSSSSREDFLDNVTVAEVSTISPDFDWAQSLWSDMFEYQLVLDHILK